MTKLLALIIATVATALVTAGATWQFGPYGLMGAGVAVFIALFVFDIEE
jgi:hypothetical protein